MLIHNRMPARKLPAWHDPACTDDLFALRVICETSRSARVEDVLRSYGPGEVRVEK